MSPHNIADRIRLGVEALVAPPAALLLLALEVDAPAIAVASPALLREWATALKPFAAQYEGLAGQHWASIASELESGAMERSTEVGR